MKKLLLATALVAVPMVASASTIIDFTDRSEWSGNQTVGVYDSFTVTLSSNGLVNFDQDFDGSPTPPILAFDSDGLGVGDDEISALDIDEYVTLTFDNPVLVDAIAFLDLFRSAVDESFEQAIVDFGGGDVRTFDAIETYDGTVPGYAVYYFADVGPLTSITFTIDGGAQLNDDIGNPDYALAGLRVQEVPLPAAGFLLLGSLGGLAAMKRRKKS